MSEGRTWPGLTRRESQVADLIVLGRERREIALLFRSPRTYDIHRFNIIRKLGVRNSVELCLYAIRNGLLRVDVERREPWTDEQVRRFRKLAAV